jgi:hypothetical protein
MSIARRRIGKHIPGKPTSATEGLQLLRNGPLNTPP